MIGKWCHAIIDTNALTHNLAVVKRHCPGSAVVAMVKSNAYGHGATIVAKALQQAGVTRFGVATLHEAAALREAGITGTILLADTSWVKSPRILVDLEITPLLSSVREIQVLHEHLSRAHATQPYPVHLKVDTGMSRMGVTLHEGTNSLAHALDRIKQSPALHLHGMCTHFADADEWDDTSLCCQIKLFGQALHRTYQMGLSPQVVHMANSSAIFRGYHQGKGLLDHPARQPCWWARPGGLLYGLNLSAPGDHEQIASAGSVKNTEQDNLRPVLLWRAPILLRKRIPKGARVGYGGTWRAERDTEIAVLAAGYGDGYNRLLSNGGCVLIGGQRAPIVGRVSMDLTTVDVTDVQRRRGEESCRQGAHATLLGRQGDESIDVWELARLCGTIPYEICTSITARVRRIVEPTECKEVG
ncbi:MAG: alanine racemase [Myxococcota bacterium]